MSGPNAFTDGTLVGIVVGGDVNDPAPDQSCNMKIFIPGLHGKDVQVEHLAFSTMQKMPTNAGQQTFEGTLDPGSVVFVRKDTGSNQCHIVGTGNEMYDPDARVGGNMDLLQIAQVASAIKRQIDVRIPPSIEETTEGGVKVRKAKEKGDLHSHDLLKGIPANGAIFPLSGSIVPNVTNIASATQAFNMILSPALAALLPGVNVSLGNLLGTLVNGTPLGALAGAVGDLAEGALDTIKETLGGEVTGLVGAAATTFVDIKMAQELRKQTMSRLSPQMRMSLGSMSKLTSSIETGTGGGFMSGGRVDPSTYLNNAADLLGQCRSVGDMVSCMQQVQYDKSLFGQNNLPNVSLMVDTPFGIKMPMSLSPTGAISQVIPPALKTAMDAFKKAAGAFPGVNPGENLFGDSAAVMLDMFGRLPGPQQAIAMQLAQKLNTGGAAQTFNNTLKNTVQGGNPFSAMFS